MHNIYYIIYGEHKYTTKYRVLNRRSLCIGSESLWQTLGDAHTQANTQTRTHTHIRTNTHTLCNTHTHTHTTLQALSPLCAAQTFRRLCIAQHPRLCVHRRCHGGGEYKKKEKNWFKTQKVIPILYTCDVRTIKCDLEILRSPNTYSPCVPDPVSYRPPYCPPVRLPSSFSCARSCKNNSERRFSRRVFRCYKLINIAASRVFRTYYGGFKSTVID